MPIYKQYSINSIHLEWVCVMVIKESWRYVALERRKTGLKIRDVVLIDRNIGWNIDIECV